MFRAEAGNGRSVYQRWTTSEYNSPTDPACQELTKNNCPDHYRHELLDGYSSDDFENMNKVSMNVDVLLDFSLTVKAATLIFISGRGSAILSAK